LSTIGLVWRKKSSLTPALRKLATSMSQAYPKIQKSNLRGKIKNSRDSVSEKRDPRLAQHKPAEFIESGPLAELDRSGYIDRLYATNVTQTTRRDQFCGRTSESHSGSPIRRQTLITQLFFAPAGLFDPDAVRRRSDRGIKL
jgi:hypothetical protein